MLFESTFDMCVIDRTRKLSCRSFNETIERKSFDTSSECMHSFVPTINGIMKQNKSNR